MDLRDAELVGERRARPVSRLATPLIAISAICRACDEQPRDLRGAENSKLKLEWSLS
jgi:hypothetical protein